MKTSKYIFALVAAALIFAGCDKHDKLDDLVFVGPMAPHVQWTVTGTTVTAGSDVPFSAKYYTTGESPVDHLEVWYNISEKENKFVSAPFVSSFSYSVSSEITSERRISQSICKIAHNENWWNATERSYNFDGTFPTSSTLGRISWSAADWDSTLVETYYGATFMQHFKDSLETLLKADVDASYKDYATLYTNLGGDSKQFIKLYTDSTYDENTTMYVKHFKNHVLPEAIDSLYKSTTFSDLIYSAQGASISYSKQYILTAQLKCYDEAGTAGLSLTSEITLN